MQSEKIGVLVKTSLVDYPGIVAATLFLTGCNLRCPYCYNGPLVQHQEEESAMVSLAEVISHLEKRKNVLKGFVISGGEALLHPKLKSLIIKAKELGYLVKLDTNGTNPDKLEEILNNPDTKPDFIAMDIKTDPKNYKKTLNAGNLSDTKDYVQAIKKSISMISTYQADKREFRTVLVPTLVTLKNISILAQYLPKDASWRFAQFQNENCLEPLYNALKPYSDIEIKEIINKAITVIPDSKLR